MDHHALNRPFSTLSTALFYVALYVLSAAAQNSPGPGLAAGEPASRQNQQEQDKAIDKQHLRQIYDAIQAYCKDHGDLPNWMSDLVPQYLKDASVLISPVEGTLMVARIGWAPGVALVNWRHE